MSPVRIIILAVAAVAAIGLAFLVRGIAGGGDKAPETVVQTVEKPTAKVLVASRDLAVGARITREDLRWQSWPLESVNPAYITDGSVSLPEPAAEAEEKDEAAKDKDEKSKTAAKGKKDEDAEPKMSEAQRLAASARELLNGGGPMEALAGSVVREPIMKGDPITERKLVRAGDSGYLAVVLAPGMRAMSVPVSVETAAGGFILPGDRVDVIMSRQVQGNSGSNEHRSDTVMRNVKVLAVDQVTKPENGAQSVVGATATLEVGAVDAEVLAQADAAGDIALVLRSYADVGGPSGAAMRPQLARDAGSVRVWRDGEATSVSVQ
jgi:pilus assembly protein CpaB